MTSSALHRRLLTIDQRRYNRLIVEGHTCVNFCSNDYLGLSMEPSIRAAFVQGIQEYGVGSGSSLFLSGYFKAQRELEEALAAWLHRDKVIVFNSGYLANLGVMTALSSRRHVIISDRLCHASLLDGIQLSRAKHQRFQHNDMAHLQSCLAKLMPQDAPVLVVTEGVFSMEGDIAPLDQIVPMVHRYQAKLIVDDAHGIGILGAQGGGICEHFQLSQQDVSGLVLPFGKAFGGMGAAVAGSYDFIETMVQAARSLRYTTALPPALSVALLRAVAILKEEHWRRQKLMHLIQFFMRQAQYYGWCLTNQAMTPIQSLFVSDDELLVRIQQIMLERGFFIAIIRPPTVPIGKSRIRISLNCYHTEAELLALLDELSAVLHEYNQVG